MSNINEKIKNALMAFSEEVRNDGFFDLDEIKEYSVKSIKEQKEKWEWADDTGIYYFLTEIEIPYIGKTDSAFGERIADHLKETEKTPEEWKKDISDPTSVIGFIPIEDEQYNQKLEKHLIGKLNPKHNERRG